MYVCGPKSEGIRVPIVKTEFYRVYEDSQRDMAHPKRRQSHTRQAKRRTHDVVKAPTLATCPNCGALHIYHTVCPSCGYYRGKLAIEQAEA